MHLKYNFETMKLDDWTVAVPVGDSASLFQGVVKLSETANIMFNLLKNETSIDKMADELAKQFAVPKESLYADVSRFIGDLEAKGLLDNENDN